MVKFYYHGVDSSTKNIKLQKPLEFSPVVPIVNIVQVAGRNGTLHIETSAYENREATAECFVLKSNAENEFTAINEFLFSNKGYQRLQTDEDSAHFWLAAIKNAAEINVKMQVLAPFEIKFDCKPQRFLTSGETVVTLTSAGSIINPTAFESLPIIKITGDGRINLNVGGQVVILEIDDDEITLDSETQNAYKGTVNLNNKVSGAYPKLASGTNAISWEGDVTKIEITPRWWTL